LRSKSTLLFVIIFIIPVLLHASVDLKSGDHFSINNTILLKESQFNLDNIRIDGNTVSITQTDGDLNLNANGSGKAFLRSSLIVDSTGNVGIGTSSPESKLDIANPSSGPAMSVGRKISVASVVARSDASGGFLILDSIDSGDVALNFYHTADVILANGGGNVGVGIDDPSCILDVKGSSSTQSLRLRSGDSSTQFNASQILLSYNNSLDYTHSIKTRHNSSGDSNNAIDFFTWDHGVDGDTDVGTLHNMTIQNGTVGIGTTNPSGKLHVYGPGQLYIIVESTNSNAGVFYESSHASAKWLISSKIDNGGLQFYNEDTTTHTMYFLPDGKVGIGTTTPVNKLDVEGAAVIGTSYSGTNTASSNGLIVEGAVGIGTTAPASILHIRGNPASGGTVQFTIDNQAGSINDNDRISFLHDGNEQAYIETNLNSGWPTDLIFGTATGQGSGLAERMRIKSDGKVGIGTSAPDQQLHVVSNMHLGGMLYFEDNSGYVVGIKMPGGTNNLELQSDDYIYFVESDALDLKFSFSTNTGVAYKPGGGSWSVLSDIRLKKNIRKYTRSAVDLLSQINVVEFEWINPEEHNNQKRPQVGIIAQELEKLFPDWVTDMEIKNKDAALIPNNTKAKTLFFPSEFNAYVIQAIKELKTEKDKQINDLKSIIEDQEKRINLLLDQIEKIKN
ncbi:tail fiber domain-containing protein, partial [Candidatus Margulisiibacteriota bacterium]